MKRRIAPPPPACHHEQQTPYTCVAACACMLRKRLGQKANEAALHAEMLQRGIAGLKTAAMVLRWRAHFVDWDKADEREALFAHLTLGTWLLVDVYVGHLTMHAERLPGPPISRHGPLMPRGPSDVDRKEDLRKRIPQDHHAIVLVAVMSDGFHYLDPWFPRTGQPFFIGRAEFADMWTGQVVIPA